MTRAVLSTPRGDGRLAAGGLGRRGDHRIWLNEDTAWSWRRIYQAEERMRDLKASRTPRTSSFGLCEAGGGGCYCGV